MAAGKIHAQATMKVGLTVTAVSGILTYMLHPVFVGVAVGAWLGHLATPDLDHHYLTYDELRIRRWNKVAGWTWTLFWKPYELTHRHRGSSHTWPRGTLVRWIYLLWFPIAVTVQVAPTSAHIWIVLFWICTFFGWSLADEVHYRLDNL